MIQVCDAPAVCASCGQPLTGRYCAHCGEAALDPHALTVRHFVGHTLAHETLHVDGKIWRTLRSLLFKPGLLSEEYCAGRRRLYVNPVRLLIIAIIVFALVSRGSSAVTLTIGSVTLSIVPARVSEGTTIAETITRIDRLGLLRTFVAAKAQSMDLEPEAVRARFHRKLETVAEPLGFTNVLLLALVLYALFHRKRPLLVEHGVFSMHVVSFVLLSILAIGPAFWLMNHTFRFSRAMYLAPLFAVLAWQYAYLTLAIRRFYFRGDARRVLSTMLAVTAAIAIYLLNSLFITVVQTAGAAWALWSL
jgi:uncharacterized membrane protein YkgB